MLKVRVEVDNGIFRIDSLAGQISGEIRKLPKANRYSSGSGGGCVTNSRSQEPCPLWLRFRAGRVPRRAWCWQIRGGRGGWTRVLCGRISYMVSRERYVAIEESSPSLFPLRVHRSIYPNSGYFASADLRYLPGGLRTRCRGSANDLDSWLALAQKRFQTTTLLGRNRSRISPMKCSLALPKLPECLKVWAAWSCHASITFSSESQ